MPNRPQHRKSNLEKIGSDSYVIDKFFIDQPLAIRRYGPRHQKVGHDPYTRTLISTMFGKRGIAQFDNHVKDDLEARKNRQLRHRKE